MSTKYSISFHTFGMICKLNIIKMKTRNRNWGIGLILLMCSLFITPIIATSENQVPMELDGSWGEGQRSISHEYPISATYDAFNIYIESTSTRSDITVKVLENSGIIVIEENANAEELPIVIPIGCLQRGAMYQLVLTNQWGDRLTGEFQID